MTTAPAAGQGSGAAVPFLITQAMRRRLLAAGYTPADLRTMTPTQAWVILAAMPAEVDQAPTTEPSPAGRGTLRDWCGLGPFVPAAVVPAPVAGVAGPAGEASGEGGPGPADASPPARKLHGGIASPYGPLPVSKSERVFGRTLAFALQSGARELLPADTALAGCLIWPRAGAQTVEGRCSGESGPGRGHVAGLQHCGGVWICPVCGGAIAREREAELRAAVDAHPELHTAMLTFTVRHKAWRKLDDEVRAVLAAFRRLKSGKSWQRFTRRIGLVGSVRALEPTVGRNGWHVHIHALAFFDAAPDARMLRDALARRWRDALARDGRIATLRRGVEVTTGRDALARYVAKWGRLPADERRPFKWGAEAELLRGREKSARAGRSPMELLRAYALDGDTAAGDLWREYAVAFKGRHQLQYSPGLRELLSLPDTSDADIVEAVDDGAEAARVLARLAVSDWRKLYKRGWRERAAFYAALDSGDLAVVADWLADRGIAADVPALYDSGAAEIVAPAVGLPVHEVSALHAARERDRMIAARDEAAERVRARREYEDRARAEREAWEFWAAAEAGGVG